MNKYARKRIFKRLNSAVKTDPVSSSIVKELIPKEFNQIEKIEALKSLMEAMRTEVHVIDSKNWIDSLTEILRGRGLRDLLYAPGIDMGMELEKQWESNKYDLPELIPYNEKIEQFKSQLFKVDASITTAKGAIADVGAIILCPDEKEPRTMSLVPPIHFVVLDEGTIYSDLSEAMDKQKWNDKIPTNALLISGPSKTADIELTLAFGVHGPKELVVLIQVGEPK